MEFTNTLHAFLVKDIGKLGPIGVQEKAKKCTLKTRNKSEICVVHLEYKPQQTQIKCRLL